MEEDEQRQLERLAIASLTAEECPAAEQLAAYILGQLTENEALMVAAHVRECPLCQHLATLCRPAEPRPRTQVARLMPQPLSEGRRSSGYRSNVRQYVAADLVVELTIIPSTGDYWRVTGQVLRGEAPLAGCRVTMRAGKRRYQQSSDAQGFFTFTDLPVGQYTLTLTDGAIQVQIRSLQLRLEDD